MPIRFTCSCGASIQVRDELAGRKVRCPKCGSPASIPVPAPGATTELSIRNLAGEAVTLLDRPEPGTRGAPPGEMLGRYPVEGSLGSGGMGDVLLVRDPDLGRTLAAKVIRGREGDIDRTLFEKFVIEAQVTGQLEHPNIVPVHELAVAPDGRVYFTMKEVRGRDLAKVLAESRSAGNAQRRTGSPNASKFSLSRLLEVFLKVLDAVGFAHSKGVIHRDLKPANVMVGEFGEVLVMDWGLARTRGTELGRRSDPKNASGSAVGTADGAVMGTPSYMPPEQADGEVAKIDARSDIYSLGAILYEILTLEPPYTGKTAWAIIEEVSAGNLVLPSRRAPERDVPRELEAAVVRAMAPAREDRYQTVAEFRADIEAYLSGRTLAAAEYSPWQLLAKWARRNKVAVLGGAATAAALVFGIVGIAYVLGWAEAKRLRSVDQARLDEEARAARERVVSGTQRYEGGAVLWDEAEAAEVFNRAAPQGYFRSRVAALLAMGGGYEEHPEHPAAWRETILDRSRRLEEQAMEVADWVLADVLVESTRNWGVRTAGEVELARRRVRDAFEDAARQDVERLEAAIHEILEREKTGVLIPGELDERARRLARSTGPAATGRALELLGEDRAAIERVYLATFLGKKADADTPAAGTSAPAVILAALAEQAADPDPRGTNEAVAWVRAAERFELVRPGSLAGVDEGLGKLAERGAGAVAVAATGALDRLREARAGRSALGSISVGSGEWERAVADQADLVLARARSGRRYLAHLVELAAGRGDLPLSGSAAAFVHEEIGLAGDPDREALAVLAAAFDRAASRLPEAKDRETLEEAASAALALSRLEAPGFSKNLQAARYRIGQDSTFWYRTRLAMGLLPLDWDEPGTASAWNNRGLARLEQGDLAGAVADFTRAIQLDQDFTMAYVNRGIARREQGDLAGAIADHTQAIEIDPTLPAAYSNRGSARHAQGDLAGASADFTRAIELAPGFAPAYVNRGSLRNEQGDLAGAIADYTRAIELDPDFAMAYNNRGNAKWAQRDLAGAIADYTRAIELDPDFAMAYVSRGVARYDQRDFNGAIADYTRAIELDPEHAAAYNGRGFARHAEGDLAGAVADFTRAIELDQRFSEAYNNRGAARRDQGDLPGAIADCTRAIELAPDFAAAYNNRGLARSDQGDLPGAVADYTRAIELDPDLAAAYSNRGLARREQGDLAGAIADYTRAIELDPDLAAAYSNRGIARYEQKDLVGAIADYTRTIELDPDDAKAHSNRGIARSDQGDLAGAVADFARAIELDPQNWKACANQGIALASLGRREEARASFERALERCPASARAAVEAARRRSLRE
ncbi:MAG: tetratricopeptide repeat protein [Planctomycetes bacterium]|nr:tetratricopeptide repeat protein [Planctomycetota bacterium]